MRIYIPQATTDSIHYT